MLGMFSRLLPLPVTETAHYARACVRTPRRVTIGSQKARARLTTLTRAACRSIAGDVRVTTASTHVDHVHAVQRRDGTGRSGESESGSAMYLYSSRCQQRTSCSVNRKARGPCGEITLAPLVRMRARRTRRTRRRHLRWHGARVGAFNLEILCRVVVTPDRSSL
jgi:hypothetical protein